MILALKRWWRWIAFGLACAAAVLFWRGSAEQLFRLKQGARQRAYEADAERLKARRKKADAKIRRSLARYTDLLERKRTLMEDIRAASAKAAPADPDELAGRFEKAGFHPRKNGGVSKEDEQ